MGVFKQTAKSGGGDFPVAPAGSHPAVLVALVDLGTHEDSYQGTLKSNRKVFLVWELTGEREPGIDRNFVLGRDYTNSLGQKAALRAIVEKWRGRALAEDEEFDLTKLLGKPCLLTLVHKTSQNERLYAKIDGVAQLPKSMACPPATLKPFSWEVGGDAADLPDWLPFVYGEAVKDKVARCEELKGGGQPAGVAAGENDSDDMADMF